MQKVSEEIYSLIDNDIYNLEGDKWWQPDFSLNLIRTLINPFRVEYSNKVFAQYKLNFDVVFCCDVLEHVHNLPKHRFV